MANAVKQAATSRSFGTRLWWLILGRTAAAVLLLLLGAFWRHKALESSLSSSVHRVAPILWAVAALTVIYSATHLLWKNYLAQARFQLFADGLLAAKLAERQLRVDVQLAAATRSLADLRALHERIVESIRSGVVTTDLQGRIYIFNAAAEEITGYKLADVRGQDASIFFGDMTRQIAASMNAAATGNVSPRFQADCLTPNGWA